MQSSGKETEREREREREREGGWGGGGGENEQIVAVAVRDVAPRRSRRAVIFEQGIERVSLVADEHPVRRIGRSRSRALICLAGLGEFSQDG